VKPLDCYEIMQKRMTQTSEVQSILFEQELIGWHSLSEEVRNDNLRRICTQPLTDKEFTEVYLWFRRIKWVDVLKACELPKGAVILEVASGSSTNIPEAMTVYDSTSKYVTANMNKRLTNELKKDTSFLPINIEIIEDDANNIGNHFDDGTFDAIFFEHSVNDVLQAIIAENTGIDTTNGDWFEQLPEMIRLISDSYTNDTLENKVKEAFLSLVTNCMSVLKPGGYMVMSHYMFQYDLDLGYNLTLWENILNVVRPWLTKLTQAKEVVTNGFDPQWWVFLRKLDTQS